MSWLQRISPGRLIRALAGPAQLAPVKSSRPLDSIIVPSAQDRWLGTTARDYTPDRIEEVLRSSMSGNLRAQWELFDLMEATWPRLQKNLAELKDAVVALDWGVEAWSEDESLATPEAMAKKQFCESAIWRMRARPEANENAFEATLRDVMDAWGKGIAVLEIDWQMADGIVPRATRWINPRYYGYAWENDELRLNLSEIQSGRARSDQPGLSFAALAPSGQFIPFPENKFLVCIAKQKSGHPIGGSLLRALAWWWCAANFSGAWILNFAQIFGLPIRWATYDTSQPGVFKQVCDMLERMGSSAWGAFPQGTQLELKEPAKSGADNPQAALLDRADLQCDLLILGQTLTTTTGGTGSRALGDVHERIRGDRVATLARWAAAILNQQFLGAICRLNYGDDTECPYFVPAAREPKDAVALAQRDQILASMGVAFPRNWFYARHEIPPPDPSEETVGGQQLAVASPDDASGSGRTGASSGRPGQTTIKAIDGSDPALPGVPMARIVADAAGARAKWLSPVSAELDRLAKLAKDKTISNADLAAFFETAQQRLPELFGDLDQSQFVSRVESGLGTAALAGARDGIKQKTNIP